MPEILLYHQKQGKSEMTVTAKTEFSGELKIERIEWAVALKKPEQLSNTDMTIFVTESEKYKLMRRIRVMGGNVQGDRDLLEWLKSYYPDRNCMDRIEALFDQYDIVYLKKP